MKHARPGGGTRDYRIQEQMVSCGISPVAGPVLENDRCLEFHRNLQIPMQATSSFEVKWRGRFGKDRQAAEQEF